MLIAPEEPGGETFRVPVLRVFDGDGFLTRIQFGGREIEATVRFGFIDAPELAQPGGLEAKAFLERIIANQWLDIAILMKMDTGGIVDRHGRIVAVPYLKQRRADEADPTSILSRVVRAALRASHIYRNIELEMVLNGWAWVLDRYGPDPRYFEALNDAQRNQRGIWARSDNLHPWEFKKERYANRRRSGNPPQRSLGELQASRCPQEGCGGKLVQRTGKYGDFFGCSEFPRCRYSCKSPS